MTELNNEQLKRMHKEEARIARLEAKRIEAMSKGDAATYSRLCNYLGVRDIDIERPELIEQYRADRIYAEKQADRLEAEAELQEKSILLRQAQNAGTYSSQIDFLRRLGYQGVKVAGRQGTAALNAAPQRNVYSAYMRERGKLERQVRELKERLGR